MLEHLPPGAQVPEVTDPLEEVGTLASVLPSLREERPPSEPEAGSTPLPDEWALMRATFGGVRPSDILAVHDPQDTTPTVTAERRFSRAHSYGRLSRGLHVFVGHTGGGKTGLALNCASAALKEGHPVVYVSLELDRREIAARLLGLEAKISWADLSLARPLAPHDQVRRDTAIRDLQELLGRVYVWAPDPGPGHAAPTAETLRRIVYEAARRHNGRTPLVIFDYLQAPGFYGQDEVEERRLQIRERIAVITMQLRHLSKPHEASDAGGRLQEGEAWPGCPVLVLSTTARSNVRGGESTAGMTGEDPDLLRHDLLEALKALPKEAGEIEASAVTMWALSLQSLDTAEAALQGRRLTLRLAKHRMGPAGQWIPMRFDGITGAIVEDPARYKEARLADAAAAQEAAMGRGKRGRRAANEERTPVSSFELLRDSTR